MPNNTTENQNPIEYALALYHKGQFKDAIKIYDTLLQSNPNHVGLLVVAGIAHADLQENERALELMLQAISIDPNDANAHTNIANLYTNLYHLEKALTHAKKALELSSQNTAAVFILGRVYTEKNEYKKAISLFEKAQRMGHDIQDSLYAQIHCLIELQEVDKAHALLKTVKLNNNIKPTNHLLMEGRIYDHSGRLDEAITNYNEILKNNPNHHLATLNLGVVKGLTYEHEHSIQLFRHAVKLKEKHIVSQWNLALGLLSTGHYKEGWSLYKQWRWQSPQFTPYIRKFNIPEWKGDDLRGRHLLIYAEQAIGDQVLYAMLIELLDSKANNITVTFDPRLEQLMKRSLNCNIDVDSYLHEPTKMIGAKAPDVQIAMADLAVYFNIGAPTSPKPKPYLKVDQYLTKKIRNAMLQKANGRKLIGLSWKTSGTRAWLRSFKTDDLKLLATRDDLCFINLQYDQEGATDANELLALFSNSNWLEPDEIITQNVNFFYDIDMHAAFINACDCIISIGNFTANLAGAIGKPLVYIVSPAADYRAGNSISGTDCWFNSASILRYHWNQPKHKIIQQALNILDEILNTKSTKTKTQTAHHHTNMQNKDIPANINKPSQEKNQQWIKPFLSDLTKLNFDTNDWQYLNNLNIVILSQGKVDFMLETAPYNSKPIGSFEDWAKALEILNSKKHKMLPDLVEEALLDCCHQILKITPNHPNPWQWLSGSLLHYHRPFEGEKLLRKTLTQFPNEIETMSNLAVCLTDLHRFEEAESYFRKAMSSEQDNDNYRFNYAWFLLKVGRFKEAWPLLESRFSIEQYQRFIRPFRIPRWRGESLKGKTLLISAEQGLGEQIMFARLADRFLEDAKNVWVSCKPKLEPLMQRSLKANIAVGAYEQEHLFAETIKADYYIPMGSLPLMCNLFDNKKEILPAYIKADPMKIDYWYKKISAIADGRMTVGIAWFTTTSSRRNIDIPHWIPLLSEKNVAFFNLQYPPTQKTLDALQAQKNITIHDLGINPYEDIDDLAAIIMALDMVISSQNSTVHLAGGLGAKTWVMLPYGSDWRWEIERETMRWYKSVKVFRQPKWNDWSSVMQRIHRRMLLLPPLSLIPTKH